MLTPRICLAVILFMSVIGGAAWNWKQRKEIARLQTVVASGGDPAKGQSQLNDALARIRVLQTGLNVRGSRVSTGASQAVAVQGFAVAGPLPAPTKEAARDPEITLELRKLSALETKAKIDLGYAPFFRELVLDTNTTPAQLEGLKKLLFQRQQLTQDTAEDFSGSDGVTLTQTVQAVQNGVDEQIRQTLGEPGYSRYVQYQQTLPQRNTARLVAQTLDSTAAAPTERETEQLVGALSQSSTILFSSPDSFSPVTDKAIETAATVLPPAQVQALQQVQLQQTARGKLFRWLENLRRPVPLTGGGPHNY
jgi:hypothetical protein